VAQALVPLKDLVQAKSRLAGLLRPSERRALAQAMIEDVLAVLEAHPEIEQVTLVSDDPGASLLAQQYQADHWSEDSLGCRGLNPLIEGASERLLGSGEVPLIVLHGDLPLLTGEDISAVLQSQRVLGGLIIGCDRRAIGTNLLAYDSDSVPRFCFGSNSCAEHQASAQRRGIPVEILQRIGTSLDVDEFYDLKYLMDILPSLAASSTVKLLREPGLMARLSLALETLPCDTAGQIDKVIIDKTTKGSVS
jgi:2-phospho-L-lactate guanylyltransferase